RPARGPRPPRPTRRPARRPVRLNLAKTGLAGAVHITGHLVASYLAHAAHMTNSAPASAPIIEAHGLVKRFGKVKALAGLDLVAEPGRVVAVLGPNGAGKTTFVRSLATLVRPDAATLRVGGVDAPPPHHP